MIWNQRALHVKSLAWAQAVENTKTHIEYYFENDKLITYSLGVKIFRGKKLLETCF